MQFTTIGLDLAMNVPQVHGVTDEGTVVFNRSLRRAEVHRFFESVPPCLVGIEACGTGHYWAREIAKLGHEVRLIPPGLSEALCEARQVGCDRCRGDLRGGDPSHHALCGD